MIGAEALRVLFVLKNTEVADGGEYVDPIPDAWEEAFIDAGRVRRRALYLITDVFCLHC